MTLANKITFFRICLIPVFVVIALLQIPHVSDLLAAVIFVFAAATDALDGYIARSRNQITVLGKFLDPLADKLLICSALIVFVQIGRVDAWIVILIIMREFAITGLRTIAVSEGEVVAASPLGKLKTISQIIAVTALFLQNTIVLQSFMSPFAAHVFAQILLYLALFFTLYSGVDYIWKCRTFLFTKNAK